MTMEIAIVLGLLTLAMVLFATEWVSVDIVALGLIAALIVTGILSPADAFAGFGSEVTMILASTMVLAGAIVKAGVMDRLGRLPGDLFGGNKRLSVLAILSVSAASSAVLSNTNTTAILIPPAMETARRAGISASRLLMPLAFASMLGGSATLIGTSTNLAGSGMVERLGLAPFSLFEFLLLGAIISVVGLLWLVFPGQAFFRDRRPVEGEDRGEPRRFFTTLSLAEGSRAIDRPIGELDFEALDTDLLEVVRNGERLSAHHSRKLRAGDELIVRASQNGLLMLHKSSDYELEADLHFSERYGHEVEPVLAEAVITPQSSFIGQSLKQIAFFDRTQGIVLAVYRRERTRPARIENLVLQPGDVLLLQGPRRDIDALGLETGLRVLKRVETTVLTRRQGAMTLGAMTLAISASVLGLVPFSLAILVAVLAVVVLGCITMTEAYRFIDWRLLVLIAGMSSFGLAMESSGAAGYLAAQIVQLSQPFGPVVAMVGFSVLAVLLTQPMSNAAAALTVIPVAVAAADGLGLDARMLAILVTLSASLSFISPLEPACLLVYDPGRYRFLDYTRAGLPLTLISITLLIILVPLFWG
jgi:di/tricarboxylate transporter